MLAFQKLGLASIIDSDVEHGQIVGSSESKMIDVGLNSFSVDTTLNPIQMDQVQNVPNPVWPFLEQIVLVSDGMRKGTLDKKFKE